MNTAQRRLSVGGFAALCWVTASLVNKWFDRRTGEGGWFNYAPNNGVAFSPSSGWIVRELVVWLVAILVWYAMSYRLLNEPDDQ